MEKIKRTKGGKGGETRHRKGEKKDTCSLGKNDHGRKKGKGEWREACEEVQEEKGRTAGQDEFISKRDRSWLCFNTFPFSFFFRV